MDANVPSPVYAVIMQAKAAESRALASVAPALKRFMLPLLDVPAAPNKPSISFEKHLATCVKKIEQGMRGGGRFLVDAFHVPLEQRCRADNSLFSSPYLSDRHYVSYVLESLVGLGLQPTPVYGFDRDRAYLAAVAGSRAFQRNGMALRLEDRDILDPDDLSRDISDLCRRLTIPYASVDLIIDLKDLARKDFGTLRTECHQAISALCKVGTFRSLFLCGSSIPKSVSHLPRGEVSYVERTEYKLWHAVRHLLRQPSVVGFADYGVIHPIPFSGQVVAPKNINAKVRHTTEQHWAIARGGPLGMEPARQQFPFLAAQIARLPTFSGPSFSWGDSYLYERAIGHATSGYLREWLAADTNHHLHFAIQQICRDIQVPISAVTRPMEFSEIDMP